VEEGINPEHCSGLPVTLAAAGTLSSVSAVLWMAWMLRRFSSAWNPHAMGSSPLPPRLNITAALLQRGSCVKATRRSCSYSTPWASPLWAGA